MSIASVHPFPVARPPGVHHTPISRWRQKSTAIRCCMTSTERRTKKNHYELLGVSANSTPQQIKEAYRKMQKRYHQDIAGEKGHEHTLMLNEAYTVLMREDLRSDYDASIGHDRVGFGRDASGLGYSSWEGALRPQALFVDENACIGCRECVHHAGNTFMMDETLGSARVKVQYGDDDKKIDIIVPVSVDSCPVNCIHWVEREDLEVLEFLVRPQPKEGGYGIFGQGWERPANVFMAAKSFGKQLKQQSESQRSAQRDIEPETPAQAQARASASEKLRTEKFSRIWKWAKEFSGQ